MRPRAGWVIGALSAAVAACSGRTEHGGGASAGGRPATPAAASAEPAPAARRHVLVVLELEPGAHSGRIVMARPVELPLPRRRGPERSEPWRVEVLADDGAVLYSAPLADASQVRAEFPDPQTGELRGVAASKRVTAVTLRLPELERAKQVRIVDVAGGGSELVRVAYPQVSP